MAHVTQSLPDPGLGFQVQVLKRFSLFALKRLHEPRHVLEVVILGRTYVGSHPGFEI